MVKKKDIKPTLRDIRKSFLDEIAGWERRAEVDIFIDGHDGWDLAKEGIALLDKYEEAGYDTGKREFHEPKRVRGEDG